MSRGGFGRNDPCFCGSGKKYKKCCYPRTLPDFSKPNAGLPDPFEEHEATYRAMSRQEAHPPQDKTVSIEKVDVGRTQLLCAPLARYGDGVALPGTLAPPTPLQVEAKYNEIRDSNSDGVTEVVITYTYPDLFGFAEARTVFDADEHFRLVDGRVVSVLDLFRGMQVQMANGMIGTIQGNPERRYDIPVAPLPDKDGLWSSRVIGLVKHTAHEVVEFRWAGQMVRVTPGHVVWSADRRGWVGAHELLPGELIRVAGNVVAPVEGVRRVPGFLEVFGIEVEYFHNYFVGTGENAMLVHNGPEKVAKPLQAAVPKGGRMLGARSELDLATEAGMGFGKLKGAKIKPTKAEVELIEQHLGKFGPDAPNEAMLARIKSALAEGRTLEGADAHFYAHELLEQRVMKELMQGGHYTFAEAYDVAHRHALEFYRASGYSLYHVDVIKANLGEFNTNWLKFWELMK